MCTSSSRAPGASVNLFARFTTAVSSRPSLKLGTASIHGRSDSRLVGLTIIRRHLAVYSANVMKGGPEVPDVNDLEGNESEASSESASIPEKGSAHPLASRRAAELLRQGEELFERARYEEAIHVWTRIRFLDRRDFRAQASIDRAKRAVAERQRRLDVELVGAIRLLDDGDVDTAREMVSEVLRQDPRHTEAHQLSERLAVLDRRMDVSAERTPSAADIDLDDPATKQGVLLRVPRTPPTRRLSPPSGTPMKMAGFVLGAILVLSSGALYLYLHWESIVSDGAFGGTAAAGPVGAFPVGAPVPDGSQLHFYNGERLYQKGRYREALAELSVVGRSSSVAEEARSLILRIEQRLLRGVSESNAAPETSR